MSGLRVMSVLGRGVRRRFCLRFLGEMGLVVVWRLGWDGV